MITDSTNIIKHYQQLYIRIGMIIKHYLEVWYRDREKTDPISGAFSRAMFGDSSVLLRDPDLVADTWLNFASALW